MCTVKEKSLISLFVSERVAIFCLQLSDLIIETAETARQEYFLHLFLTHEVPTLFIGPTGTGKSAITNNYLLKLPKDQ